MNSSILIAKTAHKKSAMSLTGDVVLNRASKSQPARNYHEISELKPYQAVMPTVLNRTGLFRPSAAGIRDTLVKEIVPSDSGVELTYLGYPLDELDADVLYELMRRATKPSCASNVVEFVLHDFVKALGRVPCADAYGSVKSSIGRLFSGRFTLVTKKIKLGANQITGMFGLIDEVWHDDNLYKVRLSNSMLLMIHEHSASLIHFEKRLQLKNSKAKWLQRILSTSSDKKRYFKVNVLQAQMCLSEYDPSKFRADLKKAMSELQKLGLIEGFELKKVSVGLYTLTVSSN